MRKESITRRSFLGRAGMAPAALVAARHVHGRTIFSGANEKLQLGFIGVGGMGRSHFDRLCTHPEVIPVAVADPDGQRREAAIQKGASAGLQIAAYTDYREMLDRHPGIDAVFVVTPDHWHALASIDCMGAGKDVYCEKPLALTIAEGRVLCAAAKQYDRVCQTGTQQRSDRHFRHACELVRNGRIGEILKAVCFFGAAPRIEAVADAAAPDYLDWDRYLGPAPYRPFNRSIHPYHFRHFSDFSGGLIADWGVHLFDIAQWGLDKDRTSPRKVEAEAEWFSSESADFPKSCRVHYDYGDVKMEWFQGVPEAALIEPGESYGTKFYGSKGEVFVNRAGYRAQDWQGNLINEEISGNDIRLYASENHHDDFFACIRSRRQPVSDFETGHRATVIAHLGNIACRLGRPVEFDPEGQTFPGGLEAKSLIERPMRAPWRLTRG